MARPINIVRVAHQYLGVPYVWGGTNPQTGLDCSGFLQLVYRDIGVHIPRVTYDQFKTGQPVGLHQLRPGDAVFIEPGSQGPNHVGMYIGHGMVQQSPHTGTRNSIIPLKDFVAGGFVGARRYINNGVGTPLSGPTAIGRGGAIQNHSDTALQMLTSILQNNALKNQSMQQAPQPIAVQAGLPGGVIPSG